MTQTEKKFQNVTITKDEYRRVRQLAHPDSIAAIKAASNDRLDAILVRAYRLLNKVTVQRDGVVPVLHIQFVPARELKGKRWAYRKALTDTIKLVQEIKSERGLNVSPVIADLLQDAEEPAGEPMAAELVVDGLENGFDDLDAAMAQALEDEELPV